MITVGKHMQHNPYFGTCWTLGAISMLSTHNMHMSEFILQIPTDKHHQESNSTIHNNNLYSSKQLRETIKLHIFLLTYLRCKLCVTVTLLLSYYKVT